MVLDPPPDASPAVAYSPEVTGGHDWLTLAEAAEALNVAQSTMREWDNKGVFRHTWRTPGGHRRFDRREVEALKQSTVGGGSPAHPKSDLLSLVELAMSAFRQLGVGQSGPEAMLLAGDLDALAERCRRLADEIREAARPGR